MTIPYNAVPAAGVTVPLTFPLPDSTWWEVRDNAVNVSLSQATVDGLLVLHVEQRPGGDSTEVRLLRGTGSIGLIDQHGSVAGIWDMSDSALTVQGNKLTIDPGHALMPGSYKLQIAGPVVTDLEGHPLIKRADVIVPLTKTADGGNVLLPFLGGGEGPNDVALLDGKLADFTFEREGSELLASGALGNYLFSGAERVMFTHSEDVLRVSQLGTGAQLERLYRAAFDRAPDSDGLAYWKAQHKNGMEMHDIATRFLLSPEFASRYGAGVSDQAFVNSLYQNVLHRDGDAGGIAFHVANLQHGMARADVLLAFSNSPENQAAQVELVGQAPTEMPQG
ncbi:DUF4214 domain-containing protein [Massilia sp. YMA4]|uniref:DUF4214 domain-containing protein n=1 Tax=Massilia sp. YMA4 TaxID=1593482 RepID=UPI000DD14201|nr:DUF4214 domain-containing protein [Massilia sp. YMA4]AXA91087.1 hypothetical protein DPH57_07895 [Massilia sp. YMA4]